MFLAVLFITGIVGVNSKIKCYDDIDRLRCWCMDDNRNIVLRIKHEKQFNNSWFVQYEVSNKHCTPSEVVGILPPGWPGYNITGKPDKPHPPEILTNPDLEKEMEEKGYKLIGNSFYKIHTKGTYWDFARRICIEEGAHLAVINSRVEAQNLGIFFSKSIHLIHHAETNQSAFIGFHDIFEEGEYLTIFGEPLRAAGFNTWAPNKPDNRGYLYDGFSGNDCGGLYKTGSLIDLDCDWHYAFICEREYRNSTTQRKIDYRKGVYRGLEEEVVQKTGRKKRKEPGIGYRLYPGFGFYRFHTTPVVWENARLWCEREGAHLAVANNAKEWDLIKKIVNKVPPDFIRGKWPFYFVLIGFHSLYKSTVFVTMYNETVNHEGFGEGEPNNELASTVYSGENCGSIEPSGYLNDIDCHLKLPFVCQKSLYVN